MFKINAYKTKTLATQKGLTAATLANRAQIAPEMATEIFKGNTVRCIEFRPLINLGAVLNVSPFELVQNQTAF